MYHTSKYEEEINDQEANLEICAVVKACNFLISTRYHTTLKGSEITVKDEKQVIYLSNPRVTISNLQITSSNPRIIKSMKTQVSSFLKVPHFLRLLVLNCSAIREATRTFSFW